jgi:hypothetical protein
VSGWAVFALVVIAAPVALVGGWLVVDVLDGRSRLRPGDERTVAAIVARVERERAHDAAAWPTIDPDTTETVPLLAVRADSTEVLPVIEVDSGEEPDDAPTNVIPLVRPALRKRRYVDRRPNPWPRQPPVISPDPDLLQRVRDGLDKSFGTSTLKSLITVTSRAMVFYIPDLASQAALPAPFFLGSRPPQKRASP